MLAESQQAPVKANVNSRHEEERRLHARMEQIGRKLIVLSGKGGVGKSTVAANLAVALAADGTSLLPVMLSDSLAVMSIGFLLPKRSDAVIWRGPLKFGVIRQFLSDVAWGPLDFLVIDCPPGTGDEPLSVAQLVGRQASGVIVTTPQELAVSEVRRCITFCQQVSLPVAGVVENMSGFVCPQCGAAVNLFGRGGGERLAQETGVPFLGSIPIDPDVVCGGDNGKPFAVDPTPGPTMGAFLQIVRRIQQGTAAAAAGCQTGDCNDEKGVSGCGHDHEPAHHSSSR
jgi:ATP-binding protein involved in chromosome partitioning